MSSESKNLEHSTQSKRGRKRKITAVSEPISIPAVTIVPPPPQGSQQLPTQTLPSSVGPALMAETSASPESKAPRHNSQNFYTSLLEQKGLRYKVNKWLAEHAKYDMHSDSAVGCWKCNLAKDVQCGDVNLFETWYMMKQEKKDKGHTCQKQVKHLYEVGAFVPPVRCVQSKTGWCRCQDWMAPAEVLTKN